MRELSIFIDESGSDDLRERYYLVAFVFHEQDFSIGEGIRKYERAVAESGLPLLPFHASPLMNGKDQFKDLDISERKRLFSLFRVMFRHLPISYKVFVFKTHRYRTLKQIADAMRREIIDFIFDNLSWFQQFDAVKIYYDGGQGSVSSALHKAIDYALAKMQLSISRQPHQITIWLKRRIISVPLRSRAQTWCKSVLRSVAANPDVTPS